MDSVALCGTIRDAAAPTWQVTFEGRESETLLPAGHMQSCDTDTVYLLPT